MLRTDGIDDNTTLDRDDIYIMCSSVLAVYAINIARILRKVNDIRVDKYPT